MEFHPGGDAQIHGISARQKLAQPQQFGKALF
jgi:hypothetical protein